MKKLTLYTLVLGGFISALYSCKSDTGNKTETAKEKTETTLAAAPVFTVGLKAAANQKQIPYLQSFAWGRQGTKVLMIGGRIEGFHGLNGSAIFSTAKANQSIWVIDFSDYSYTELPLDMTNSAYWQFASTNMEFCQVGDSLFLAGGFGIKSKDDKKSNHTFDQMVCISVSAMMSQVALGKQGDPSKAILASTNSPFVQVTGGEMFYQDNYFYLMFGQNFKVAYNIGITGDYTSAVRKFKFSGNQITDTSSLIDTNLHRRDIPVARITQGGGDFFAGFGGVFTPNDNGYMNPVYISTANNITHLHVDTMVQKTNQYNCATASVYDMASNSSTTVLFGGIGRYQYNETTHSWQDGDNGAKLPFVKTITQMQYYNSVMTQHIQIPPDAPQMPALIGSNAIFIPDASLVYNGEVLDYSKMTGDATKIGLIYGGILSTKPTSSNIYPTKTNPTVYEVYLYKNGAPKP